MTRYYAMHEIPVQIEFLEGGRRLFLVPSRETGRLEVRHDLANEAMREHDLDELSPGEYEQVEREWLQRPSGAAGVHPALAACENLAEEASSQGTLFDPRVSAVHALQSFLLDVPKSGLRFKKWSSHGHQGTGPGKIVVIFSGETEFKRVTKKMQDLYAQTRYELPQTPPDILSSGPRSSKSGR